ncbi:DUF222 domain-containing protein, partial [Nocardioides sp.]|uniref:DUF222 domain-containing protein n=1 Tax=Nocardioides sp. TaxID=35761 RepID=UPI003568F812
MPSLTCWPTWPTCRWSSWQRRRREALLVVDRAAARLESLRLRLVAVADDVAAVEGARDVAAWLAVHTRADRGSSRRAQRLAHSLSSRWRHLADALAAGSLNIDQVEVIARALDELPDDVPAETRSRAEIHLVEQARHFAPHELRVLGRRILDVVAPDRDEDHERRPVEAEERRARRTTRLVSQGLG